MATIRQMQQRFQTVINTFDDIVFDAMQKNEESVTEYNRRQLNEEGIDKFGAAITPAYSFATVAIKRQKGQEANHVTLRDTGSLQRGLFIKRNGDSFDIESRDSKFSDIVKKYGDEVFGLTSESKRQLWVGVLKSDVVKAIARITKTEYGT